MHSTTRLKWEQTHKQHNLPKLIKEEMKNLKETLNHKNVQKRYLTRKFCCTCKDEVTAIMHTRFFNEKTKKETVANPIRKSGINPMAKPGGGVTRKQRRNLLVKF